jgi:YbbR domain-containing protein
MAWPAFRNFPLKIAALALGVLLWVTISGQQVERNVQVQLQFRNIPAALELTGDPLRTVDVRLRGATGLISALEPGHVVATVDLTDARPGFRVVPLTIEQVSVPLGVEVNSVDPPTISLTLETSGTATVPVKPTIDGEPAAGYEVAEVTFQPQTVEVSGPLSRLEDLPAAVTERISIEGATSTRVETVTLGVTASSVRLRQAQSVRVTIRIVPGPTARFPNRPIVFRNVAGGRRATAQPAVAAITVRAARAVLTAMPERPLEPYVDVAGLGPGRHTLRVRIDPREDCVVTAIEPASVSVRIQ